MLWRLMQGWHVWIAGARNREVGHTGKCGRVLSSKRCPVVCLCVPRRILHLICILFHK